MMATAHARYVRISPRRVDQILMMVRGKSVAQAFTLLSLVTKGARPLVQKTLLSAFANAGKQQNPEAWYINALANYNLKHPDAAKKSAEETLRLDGRHKYPQAETLLAQIYAEQGDYPAAAAHLQEYLKLRPDAQNAAMLKQQLSKLQDAIAQAKK